MSHTMRVDPSVSRGCSPVLPERGTEAGSESVGAHFSKNGRERSVSGAYLYIYIYIYIQKKTCRMPN
jgi:hypothetical protein